MRFGQGAAGNAGNGLQLLLVLFMELFGGTSKKIPRPSQEMLKGSSVTLGQLVAALTPNIQARVLAV